MIQPTPTPLNQLLRLLFTYLVSIRQASWPARVESDSSHAIGMLSGAYVLGHLDRQQVNRLESLIYSAATNRNRELSLRQLPYGRRFPVRRAAA